MIHSPCYFLPLLIPPFAPLFNPSQLTWNSSCCDRIRPPRSQVARKLTSPFPSPGSYTPPTQNPDPPGFSRSKYKFIRTTLRTRPISSRTGLRLDPNKCFLKIWDSWTVSFLGLPFFVHHFLNVLSDLKSAKIRDVLTPKLTLIEKKVSQLEETFKFFLHKNKKSSIQKLKVT